MRLKMRSAPERSTVTFLLRRLDQRRRHRLGRRRRRHHARTERQKEARLDESSPLHGHPSKNLALVEISII
jgi:hypothetical protein